MRSRRPWLVLGIGCLVLLLVGAMIAPEHLPEAHLPDAGAGAWAVFPMGADALGRPLLDYAKQGARVVAVPAVVAGFVVSLLGVVGGLLSCVGTQWVNTIIHALCEVVGSLPRMVVILVIALVLPSDMRGLIPLALAWAVLSAPGAMDEAAAVAERLGGARFVEALRAHGYSAWRIYLVHVVAYNLRPVVVRQGAETIMAVVFLEIALSYLALVDHQPSFTHPDSLRSWADLLKLGYPSMIPSLGVDTSHALVGGMALLGLAALMSIGISRAARSR